MENICLIKPTGIIIWFRLYSLYLRSFPAGERKPFSAICRNFRKGKNDVWCLSRNGAFLGLATTVNSPECILLDYLAVHPRHRGNGIGTAAMAALKDRYRGRGLFVEIESTLDACPDLDARRKRKRFYQNCGLTPMNVTANVFGVNMELLGWQCCLDFGEYRTFYRDNLSPWAADHIHPTK